MVLAKHLQKEESVKWLNTRLTNEEILHGLFQKDEGLARLLEAVLNQVLQAQVTDQIQAEPYERTEERKGYRK
jgi:hypothetical protein